MKIPKGKKWVTSRRWLSIFVLVASFGLGSILCQSSVLVSATQSPPTAHRLGSASDSRSWTGLVQAASQDAVPIAEKEEKKAKKEKKEKKADDAALAGAPTAQKKVPVAEPKPKPKHKKKSKGDSTESGDHNP